MGKVCGVQYRLAYGYVDRNSIPAHHDLKLVAALKSAGSDIDLLSIARWRAGLTRNDSACQVGRQDASDEDDALRAQGGRA